VTHGRSHGFCRPWPCWISSKASMTRRTAFLTVRRLFVDALIGNYSSVLEKSSRDQGHPAKLYSQHFALVADRFNDARRAYSISSRSGGV